MICPMCQQDHEVVATVNGQPVLGCPTCPPGEVWSVPLPAEYQVVTFPQRIELCGRCGNRIHRMQPDGRVYCSVKGCEGFDPVAYVKESA